MTPLAPDPPPGWPDRFAARADARLTAVGLTTPRGRACARAGARRLVETGLVLLLLSADQGQAAGLSLDPPQLTAALVGTGAQTLVLCIRRRRPVLCIGLVAALQIALFAALPPVAAVRGVAPVIAAYGCGALRSEGRRVGKAGRSR